MDANKSLFYIRCDRRVTDYDLYYIHQRHCPSGRRNERFFKYACFDCRRTFKCVFDFKVNEYLPSFPTLGRPRKARIAAVWDAHHRLWQEQRATGSSERLEQIRQREHDHVQAPRSGCFVDTAELNELKQCSPEAWWRPLVPCCPGCGNQGHQVGPSFKPPPQRDFRAWDRLKASSDALVWCRCHDIDRERVEDAYRRASHPVDAIYEEGQRRIAALREAVRHGGRTSEEECRLAIIRARSKRPNTEAWAVVKLQTTAA